MKSTLSDLWRGNIHPIEEKAEHKSEEKEARATLEKYYDTLWLKLDDEGKLMLDEMKDVHTHLSSLENENSFIQGFSLAVKMMTEAIAD